MKQGKYLFLFLFIPIVFGMSACGIDLGKEKSRKMSFRGRIIQKYNDEWNHMSPMLLIDFNTGTQEEIGMATWHKAWEYSEIGDSLIKQPDTLIIIVKKKDGTVKEFNYKF